MSTPFLLGVNYWPRQKAMYWWSNFDAAEVRDEFSVIADLGMTVVRLFLLWDDWMPTPAAVSPACLKNLVTVCDIAADLGLTLDVTFFTGHMSGPNWSPRWLLDKNAPSPAFYVRQVVSQGRIVDSMYRNAFTDPTAIAAEKLLLRTVVGALKDHPAIYMWNLGNEPDLFSVPPTAQQGQTWTREMVALIKSIDPVHPATAGLHIASLTEDNGLHVDQVFHETDIAVMHAYPMYLPWARHNLDPDLVPFTCALVSAFAGKPTLMEEWGGCTAAPGVPSEVWEWTAYGKPRQQFMASEEDLAAYVEQVLPKLLEVGALGSFMWCFADYVESLWDKPPCDDSRHERFFGLVRPDGSLKPHAEVIKRFAATKPQVQPAIKTVTLDVSSDDYYRDPVGHIVRLYEQFNK